MIQGVVASESLTVPMCSHGRDSNINDQEIIDHGINVFLAQLVDELLDWSTIFKSGKAKRKTFGERR